MPVREHPHSDLERVPGHSGSTCGLSIWPLRCKTTKTFLSGLMNLRKKRNVQLLWIEQSSRPLQLEYGWMSFKLCKLSSPLMNQTSLFNELNQVAMTSIRKEAVLLIDQWSLSRDKRRSIIHSFPSAVSSGGLTSLLSLLSYLTQWLDHYRQSIKFPGPSWRWFTCRNRLTGDYVSQTETFNESQALLALLHCDIVQEGFLVLVWGRCNSPAVGILFGL